MYYQQVNAHAYSPVKRTIANDSKGAYGPDNYSPGESSQLAVKLNASNGNKVVQNTSDHPINHKEVSTPDLSKSDTSVPYLIGTVTNKSMSGGSENHIPVATTVLDKFIKKDDDYRERSKSPGGSPRPVETLIDYGAEGYSLARSNSKENHPRIVVLNSVSGVSVPFPKKSSLLDKFSSIKVSENQEQLPPSRLVPELPKLQALSKLPDSYVDNSASNFQSNNKDADILAKEYQSPQFTPEEGKEYFSFSPQNDKWANGSTPSPRSFIDSKAFFNSQVYSSKGPEKDDGADSFTSNIDLKTLKDLYLAEKRENQMLREKVDRLENSNRDLLRGSIGEEAIQKERAKLSEHLKLVKLQSQQITEQADEYKKIADGYINQLEAKNSHLEKEIAKRDAQIKEFHLKGQNSPRSHSPNLRDHGLKTPDAQLRNILQVFKDFFTELDTNLKNSHGTFYSPNVVTHINSQIDQLSSRSPDSLSNDSTLTEVSNLKVLLASLNKVIGSRSVPLNQTHVNPHAGNDYKQDGSSSRGKSPTSTMRSSSFTANKEKDSTTEKLVEENQKLAIEFSKLKQQNKSLKDHIQDLINAPPGGSSHHPSYISHNYK